MPRLPLRLLQTPRGDRLASDPCVILDNEIPLEQTCWFSKTHRLRRLPTTIPRLGMTTGSCLLVRLRAGVIATSPIRFQHRVDDREAILEQPSARARESDTPRRQ